MEHHFHYRRSFQCLKTLRFTQVPVLVVFLSRYSSHCKADNKSLCQGALRTSVLDGPAAALHVTIERCSKAEKEARVAKINPHLFIIIKALIKCDDFRDVTLISEDGSLEEAQMVIFAAASSFSERQLKVTNTNSIMLA